MFKLVLAKRLTEKEKNQILESFKSGKSIDFLSGEFNCNKLTITRNLKKNLGELKYKEYINKYKALSGKYKEGKNNPSKINLEFEDSKKITENLQTLKGKGNDLNFNPEESFFEIAPLDYQIENSPRKELSSVPISEVDFPKIVYMVVHKNIELEIKLLKDFPNWEFLPNEDLNRKTIEIFFDLKTAKRTCGKEQKVIKVPNTDVFKIVSPILISRGISRIVSEEKLIAL